MLMLFKTPSIFFFTLLTSALSSGILYEGTGKSRMAQGRVNMEDEG